MNELSFHTRTKYTLVKVIEEGNISEFKPIFRAMNIKWNSNLKGWLIDKGTEEKIMDKIKNISQQLQQKDIKDKVNDEEMSSSSPEIERKKSPEIERKKSPEIERKKSPEIERKKRNRKKDRKIQRRYRRSRSPGSSSSDEEDPVYIAHTLSNSLNRNDKLDLSSDESLSDNDLDKRSKEREFMFSDKALDNLSDLQERFKDLNR
jgi:hypothetical protein